MNLSKAYDCMPHTLLIAKFKVYGLEDLSIQLVTSYLEGKKQRVRVGNKKSEWADIIKGGISRYHKSWDLLALMIL